MNTVLAKLDQNESPIPPPIDLLKNSYEEAIKYVNRYQRRELYEELRELYAEYSGVDREYIWIQPGVDLFFEDILIVNENKSKIVIPFPSYFLFMKQVKHYGYNIIKIPLDKDFLRKLYLAIEKQRSIIYLDNPNNPTGKVIIRESDIIPVIENGKSIILIDEAYYEFCNYTLINLVKKYDNVVIFRTMSKAFGFAGGRVAFCIMSPNLARRIFYYDIIRFRISTISLTIAKVLLMNKYYVRKVIDLIKRERERVIKEIRNLGLQVYDSCANFIMINTGIPRIANYLYERGILVKDLGEILGEDYNGSIRVTLGLPRENNVFIDALREIVFMHKI